MLNLKETIGNLPSPLKANENSLKENVVRSPPECDVLNGNGRMLHEAKSGRRKSASSQRSLTSKEPKSLFSIDSRGGGSWGKASPLTIVHVTVSFGGIQLNGLQEELFGLTLTTLEKQRKWMIQQWIMMNYFSPLDTNEIH